MRRRSTMLTALLLTSVVLLGGCGSKSTGTTEVSTQNADGKYEPALTITIAKQLDENAGKYDEGDDINNNPMTRLTEEKLGIKMDTVLLGGDAGNYDTKLCLALTGSEDLPEVFPVYGTQMIADMIESGRVKDITQDIEKYMPDRIKEIYDQYPETFYPLTKDGKIYGLACPPALTESQVMIIRQDWLDHLGLQAPTNMDEFEAVIKAFTEDDPDGNGKKDTYGFTYAGDGIYNTGWVSDPVILFSANSGKHVPGMWQEDENGQLVYGSVCEGNKATLERMAQWHANGWIFQEAAATFETAPDTANGYVIAYDGKDELIPDLFNAEPTEAMKKGWEQLQTLEKQTYTNIIYGKEPISAFDDFVAEWNAQGGEQITREINEWYKSVQ